MSETNRSNDQSVLDNVIADDVYLSEARLLPMPDDE